MPIFGNRKHQTSNLPEGHTNESSPWFVPAELREDYAAHTPSFDEIKRNVRAIVNDRATAAVHDRHAEYIESSPTGNSLYDPPGDAQIRRAVIDEGEQEGDALLAEHYARLAFAKSEQGKRERAAERERERQANKCANCGALDVPTGPLSIDLRPGRLSEVVEITREKVCARCAATMRHVYLSELANQDTELGGTRGERARAFINRATVSA